MISEEIVIFPKEIKMSSNLFFMLVLNQIFLLQPSQQSSFTKQDIDASIKRGVAFLKNVQRTDGTWSDGDIGPTALAGLALLESGLPQNDTNLKNAVDAIRKNAKTTNHTYSISLCLIFLDRLGNTEDIPLIESLAMRLLAGQTQSGGWGYNCPSPSNEELSRLENAQKNTVELKASKIFPKYNNKKSSSDLSPEVSRAIKAIYQEKNTLTNNDTGSDNSNTQFATFALWISRRHGIPIEFAFARVLLKFRRTQSQDGGWAYSGSGDGQASTATMTGAGMLCLGLASGFFLEIEKQLNPKDRIDLNKDPFLGRGLFALGSCIGTPVGKGRELQIPKLGEQGGQSYYFLWSLERAATGLGLEKINRKDWYSWGSEIILVNQSSNGSWKGDYANFHADTCFAILFLLKSNFAEDLTTILKEKTNNLGLVELKSGGVGGEGISNLVKKGGIRIAIDNDGKGGTQGKITYKNNPTDKAPVNNQETNKTEKPELLPLSNISEKNFLDTLEKYKLSKGIEFTMALALSITKLKGTQQFEARKALGERLARFTPETLLEYLNNDDPELRAAAISAIALKNQMIGMNKIVSALEDSSEWVQNCAYNCLKSLTGKDFGNPNTVPAAEKIKTLELWKNHINTKQ